MLANIRTGWMAIMSRKLTGYVETKLALISALLVCLCGGTAYGFYQHIAGLRADTEILMTGNTRARHLTTTLRLIQDAETGQRGYLLTGRLQYLTPYEQAIGGIEQNLAELKMDYVNTELSASIVSSIETHIRAKIAELGETIELRKRERLEAAQRIVLQDTGRLLMDEIRAGVNHLLGDERAVIDQIVARQRVSANRDAKFWFWSAFATILLTSFCLVLAFRDVRHGRRESARLMHTSRHDALTGLLNRTALLDLLDQALKDRPQHVGLLYLDLNRFKLINDELGHAVGDRVLVAVANILQSTLRPADHIARLGGDEFVVLVENCPSIAFLDELSDRLESAVQSIRLPETGGRPIGVSVGTAYGMEDGIQAAHLLEKADAAMYARKAQVRQQWTKDRHPRLIAVR